MKSTDLVTLLKKYLTIDLSVTAADYGADYSGIPGRLNVVISFDGELICQADISAKEIAREGGAQLKSRDY